MAMPTTSPPASIRPRAPSPSLSASRPRHMASGPAPPSLLVSSPPPQDAPPPPPIERDADSHLIDLDLSLDLDDDDDAARTPRLSDLPSGFPAHTSGARRSRPLDRSLPEHPHDAALLRRSASPSPSPSLDARRPLSSCSAASSSASGPSSPRPRPISLYAPAAASVRAPSRRPLSLYASSDLLSPDAYRTSFLRPPSAGSMTDASDDAGTGAASASMAASVSNPFNFQTEYISTTAPVKSNIGLRRGHRYKHSSVSAQHQIFQEPPPRPPPVLPASLPLPTLREAWGSMQRDQRARLYWCLCHAFVAAFVFFCAADGGDSLALTALSHLVFFDVGSAAVCVAVDLLGNFEVWRRSTIRHPFGLRRAEVLAGFAMSIFLVFGGFDLLSHDLKDWFEASAAPGAAATAGSAAHHHHAHVSEAALHLPGGPGGHGGHHHGSGHSRYVHPGSVDVPALAAFACTLVSAYGVGNHARIRRALLLLHGVAPYAGAAAAPANKRAASPASASRGASRPQRATSLLASVFALLAALAMVPGFSAVLANPFHFLTLGVSLVLLVLPLMFVAVQPWLDRLLCATIALSMLMLGARLAVAQGLMLLMSFAGKPESAAAVSLSAASAAKPAPGSLPSTALPAAASASVASHSHGNGVSSVLDEIAAEPNIARVEDAQFWQVHYGLCIANLRVRVVRGCDDSALRQLRNRVARLIQNRLGEGYGRGNSLRWEVTLQTSVEGG